MQRVARVVALVRVCVLLCVRLDVLGVHHVLAHAGVHAKSLADQDAAIAQAVVPLLAAGVVAKHAAVIVLDSAMERAEMIVAVGVVQLVGAVIAVCLHVIVYAVIHVVRRVADVRQVVEMLVRVVQIIVLLRVVKIVVPAVVTVVRADALLVVQALVNLLVNQAVAHLVVNHYARVYVNLVVRDVLHNVKVAAAAHHVLAHVILDVPDVVEVVAVVVIRDAALVVIPAVLAVIPVVRVNVILDAHHAAVVAVQRADQNVKAAATAVELDAVAVQDVLTALDATAHAQTVATDVPVAVAPHALADVLILAQAAPGLVVHHARTIVQIVATALARPNVLVLAVQRRHH